MEVRESGRMRRYEVGGGSAVWQCIGQYQQGSKSSPRVALMGTLITNLSFVLKPVKISYPVSVALYLGGVPVQNLDP